jgi:hypothetical protein
LDCPIVIDTIAGAIGVTISVWDRHRTQDVSCTIFGFDSSGNVIFNQVTHSSGNTNAPQSIGAGGTASSIMVSAECTVPPPDTGAPFGGLSGIEYMNSHAP